MRSCALSALRSVKLTAPAGQLAANGIQREWVRCVSIYSDSHTSLVQLTRPAVHAMLAAGVTCRALGTAAVGSSAAYVTPDAAGVYAQTTARVKIVRGGGRDTKSGESGHKARTARRRRRESAGGDGYRRLHTPLVGGDREALPRGSNVANEVCGFALADRAAIPF